MKIKVVLEIDIEKVGKFMNGKHRYTKDLSGMIPYHFLFDRPKILMKNDKGMAFTAKVKVLGQEIILESWNF